MFADIRRYKTDYSLLALGAGGYIFYILKHQTSSLYILIATSVFAAGYVIWGIWHHWHTESLHLKIVLEYFLVAALAVVIVSTLLV